ncbi:MAG: hypothetical protein QF741_02970 [Candidatus Peribacteraceae bacterium]|nr:hypothetical protein [Candidatus Peribacteraceae bacterium]MDP7454472.1 hypothetical protein [Candidatus Peribacteraceae bacterium]MDP7645932.1 hypothetical protein [Candidatus Peribacteraceae bacterium]|tara:strand:- start:2076 stop:2483 length:408 start_codon:yes stop_codon:yes gene_type:complete
MKQLVTYLLWPNNPVIPYGSPKLTMFLLLAFGLIVVSFTLRMWRKKLDNQVTKKLSRSWPGACLWFGIAALVLTVARAEQISYVSMRLWWVVWLIGWVVYVFFQIKMFKLKYYKKLPSETVNDPRKKYLPRRKKR